MTTRSEGLVEGGAERRLHPLSWLFVLIQQLKSFALPLVVLLFTGRGNSWELWGLAGAGVLVLVSLGQYFTYRFRVDADGIVIRSGLLQKSLRNIPFTRIHNVALHQTLLHRAFGVAEVKLESAGGMTSEGQMFAPYSFTVELAPGTYTIVLTEDDPSDGAGGLLMSNTRTVTVE